MQVEIIYVNDNYNGRHGLYADDIAIIVLREKMSFSNDFLPVCIDWNSIYKVENGDAGMVNMLYCIMVSI